MVKKKEDKKQHKNEDSLIRKVINFFKDERTYFVAGLLFVMFGVYLFISFMSFFIREMQIKANWRICLWQNSVV